MKKLKDLRANMDEAIGPRARNAAGRSNFRGAAGRRQSRQTSLKPDDWGGLSSNHHDAEQYHKKEMSRHSGERAGEGPGGYRHQHAFKMHKLAAKFHNQAKINADDISNKMNKDDHDSYKYNSKKAKDYTKAAREAGADADNRQKRFVRTDESVNEAVQYKVDVEGLPPTFMTGKSPAEIMAKLRKIVKQPSMIKSVERHTDAEVKKAFRNKAQGREIDEAGTPERLAMIRKAGEKINKEKKKAERDAKRAIAKDKDLMGETVIYHGNPNKDDDARNAARRKRLAKQDNKVKLKGFGPDAAKGNMGNPVARASLRTEASVVPSKDGKKLVPMKKHSAPKSEPVPNDQFGLPKLRKEAVYGSQAQRMMSPLQRARQDKEKADRDRHGNLNMMKGRPKRKKLGEISQDLKQRYHDKAKSDYGHQQFAADIAKEMGAKDAEKHYRRKQRNRMAGIARAKK